MHAAALLLALLLGAATGATARLEFLEEYGSQEELPSREEARDQALGAKNASRDTEALELGGWQVSRPDDERVSGSAAVPTSGVVHVREFEVSTPGAAGVSGILTPGAASVSELEFSTPLHRLRDSDVEFSTRNVVQQIQDFDAPVSDVELPVRDTVSRTGICEICPCAGETMDCSAQSMRAFLLKTTLSNITKIELSRNNLEEIQADAFASLPNLTRISVTDNYIATVDSDAFRGLAILERLDLSVNAIASLPVTVLAGQEKLQRMYIRRNRLTDFGFVAQIRNCSLEALQLTANSLARVPVRAFGFCTSLREIWLDANKISEIDADAFQGLFSLSTLDLSSNRLHELPSSVFRPLRALRVLDLSRNQVVSLDGSLFQTLTSLRSLYIPFNWLRELPAGLFSSCVSLRRLSLSDNLIEYVDPEAFFSSPVQHLPKQKVLHSKCANLTGSKANIALKHLDLSNNHLRAIPTNTFMSFPDIDELNLGHNLFTTFGPDLVCLAGALGGRFFFGGNQLVCACGALYEAFRLAERVAPAFHPVCLHSGQPWAVMKGRRCRETALAAAEARELAAAPAPGAPPPSEPSHPVDTGFHAAILAPILAVAFVTSLAAMAVSVFRRYRRARYELERPEPVRMTLYARAPSFSSAAVTNATDVSRL